jgi:ADP-ribose pyrophosphatase
VTPGPGADLADRRDPLPVARRELAFRGRVWDVVTESVVLPDGERVERDVVEHPSAVAVLVLDDADRVLLVNQYRHPVGARLWELPAGLLDVAGEDPLAAARRELWEETHHVGGSVHVLVDFLTSPGFCDEALRIYLVRGAGPAQGERHVAEGEERHLVTRWWPLDEVVAGVLAGRLHNTTLVVGTLAAAAARERGWAGLRPADAAWRLGPRSLRAADSETDPETDPETDGA